MTMSTRPAHSTPERGPLRFTPQVPDSAWLAARDARLATFIRARLAHVDATGCTDERRWATGVRDIFTEWDEKRELAVLSDNDLFTAQVSALGWALRCVALSTWDGAPGWDPAFHPKASHPEFTLEISS